MAHLANPCGAPFEKCWSRLLQFEKDDCEFAQQTFTDFAFYCFRAEYRQQVGRV